MRQSVRKNRGCLQQLSLCNYVINVKSFSPFHRYLFFRGCKDPVALSTDQKRDNKTKCNFLIIVPQTEQMKNIICPVSNEKANEKVVRITAFWVIMLTGFFIVFPNPYIPLYLAFDFYIRAFTKLRYSPISWVSAGIARGLGISPRWIDKAPKIFAARVGFLFAVMILAFTLTGVSVAATSSASVLVLFAFLECGLNFCAGCWVYTYIVFPVYRGR
jgi:hypothetical protein